jgi:hypothetical protein
MTNLNEPKTTVTMGTKYEENQQQQTVETPQRTEKWNSGNKQNQQQQTAQNNNQRKKLTPSSISISPVEFESTLRSSIYTTYEIVDMLSSVFRPAFADFFKARFYPDQKGNLVCQLLFSPTKMDDQRIHALREKGSNSINGSEGQIMQTIKKWNSSVSTASHFELTEEAKEILAPFIPPAFRIQNQMDYNYEPALPKINWKQFFREEQVNISVGFGMGVSNKIVYVVPIDIYTFAKKFWGEVGDEGGRFFYNIEPFTPMTNQFIGMPNAYGMRPNLQDTIWAFRVERCDETFLEGVKRKLGFGNV